MDTHQLNDILQQSFDDVRLSRSERKALGQVLAEVADNEDRLRYVRNRAFDMAKEAVRTHPASLVLDWLEEVVRVIDNQRQAAPATTSNVYFSPGPACVGEVVRQCRAAKQAIDVCVFTITDNRISSALMDAHARGVQVRIITDDDKMEDLGSDVYELRGRGIEVCVDDSPAHMHHKFAVFDQCTLLSGSFNWTRGASEANNENVIVTDDPKLVRAFLGKFEEMWVALPRVR